MNREKAKELADILTAYANGADLQYEAHNEWTDMKDGDAIVFCIEHGREMRVKPNPAVKQIPAVAANKTVFRPFKSCNELVFYWEREKVGYSANPLQMIDIWVKHKVDGRRRMIVGFGENFVEVGVKAKPITLERLFETYTFLDDEPCGVRETGIK